MHRLLNTSRRWQLCNCRIERLAKSYSRTDAGELVETPIRLLFGKALTARNRFPAANGGLFSTAHDYTQFCRMLLGKGVLDGVRILTEESVRVFSSPSHRFEIARLVRLGSVGKASGLGGGVSLASRWQRYARLTRLCQIGVCRWPAAELRRL